jgi:drug/metabolite transporter (DMT)-like permease
MKWPYACLMACALLWSSGGLVIKLVDWSPLAIAGGRSAIAAATILLLRPRRKMEWNSWAVACAVAYSATVIMFVTATKWTTAANAIFLQFTAPVYVAVLGGPLLGERTSRADWMRMAFAQAGISLFFLGDLSWGGAMGNLIALGSGFSFAALVVLLRKQRDANPVDSVLLGNLLTVAVCWPAMIGPLPSANNLIGLVYLGVFQLGLSYLLYIRASRHVPALSAILICMIEPVLNPIWVLLVIGEVPGWLALAGGAMVIGSAIAQGWASAMKSPVQVPEKEDALA